MPVLPASIDSHGASRYITGLLRVAKLGRQDRKHAMMVNSTRKNTKRIEKLMRSPDSLGIPIIAVLRDTQNYVPAVEEAIGICEMQAYKLKQAMIGIEKIVTSQHSWQERRKRTADRSVIEQLPNVTALRKPGFDNS